MDKKQVLQLARWVIQVEIEALEAFRARIHDDFWHVVQAIQSRHGKVILTGVGKSARIAQKITATLNSIGTPAVFLHGAEAAHGDLGIVQKGDVVLIFSKSGDTPEIKNLLPALRGRQVTLIACTGNPQSYLAQKADLFIDLSVPREACPHNLTPTASTTLALAFGDALAITLMQLQNFTAQDFAQTHPGGALGKKLLLRVQDLAHPLPSVEPHTPLPEVIQKITHGRMGAVALLSQHTLEGIITDGDIRRAIEKYGDIRSLVAQNIATPNPKCIDASDLAYQALQRMKNYQVSQLIVVQDGVPTGMIHFHDILREGIQ
ncbi:MAG: KpsF/GutQ family sugar-phosphate isomerase [Bacteroidia bacterium]